jgi:hypothetical protein
LPRKRIKEVGQYRVLNRGPRRKSRDRNFTRESGESGADDASHESRERTKTRLTRVTFVLPSINERDAEKPRRMQTDGRLAAPELRDVREGAGNRKKARAPSADDGKVLTSFFCPFLGLFLRELGLSVVVGGSLAILYPPGNLETSAKRRGDEVKEGGKANLLPGFTTRSAETPPHANSSLCSGFI